jgi:RNA polymerase sigma-70 factor (ECF subfamily)
MSQQSQQDRFEALLERHRNIVFKAANMYCRNQEDRRDLAQEISVQLWKAFPRYDEGRPFSTWMYRIALNVAISYARRAGYRDRHAVPLDESVAEPADRSAPAPEDDERVLALRRFIAQLDELNRALLLLYLEERSHRDIAEILGISETNVATKINRLKQRIRQGMEGRTTWSSTI